MSNPDEYDKVSASATDNITATALDEKFAAAANVVVEADIFLLVTGAGWSADSGLPVYDDIARVPAYERKNLTYADVSQPNMLEKDPAVFYGFWGQALNDYRHTVPHPGFEFVAGWRRDKMQNAIAPLIRERLKRKLEDGGEAAASAAPTDDSTYEYETSQHHTPYEDLPVPDMAGSFYCFTSNCDAHFYDFLPAVDIHDCHGNVEFWQCSSRHCDSGIWRAPSVFNIKVDPETLEAPPVRKHRKLAGEKAQQKKDPCTTRNTPCLGHSQGLGIRDHFLQFMPRGRDIVGWHNTLTDENDETPNWPKCGHCLSLARPAILMFGDFGWKYDHAQNARWNAWRESVIELCRETAQDLKVCIFEVGCGKNVSTCRTVSEQLLEDLVEAGFGDSTSLVRINPDFPEADDEDFADYVISVPSKGLAAIERIQEHYMSLRGVGTVTSKST